MKDTENQSNKFYCDCHTELLEKPCAICENVYRPLTNGEIIESDDDFLNAHTNSWRKIHGVGVDIGSKWKEGYHVPFRRKTTPFETRPCCTYALNGCPEEGHKIGSPCLL